jgi:hypothetical protein
MNMWAFRTRKIVRHLNYEARFVAIFLGNSLIVENMIAACI